MIKAVRIVVATLSLYLGTHLFVFTVLPFVILISYLDRQRIPAIRRWFARSLFAIVGTRVEVLGREDLDPTRRYVIVSNYPSGYAGFALLGEFTHASIVAHAFLRRIPLLGQALSRVGVVYVRPGASGRGRKALDLYLGRRDDTPSLIILPEGRITRDGKIHRFRRGFVHIQRQTSYDILPVTLNEFYKLKPFGRPYADPDARPEMVIHPPIPASAGNRMRTEELIDRAREVIEAAYRP